MKRFEKLNKKETAWEVVKPICDKLADLGDWACQLCPFSDRCSSGHNGVMDYLMEEVTE